MMSLSGWRRVSQFTFLVFFVVLFYKTQYPLEFVYTNILLRASPLIMISNILITYSFSVRFLPAILLLVATLFLGRFFCGWICPVGTISDLIPKTKRRLSFHRFKYYFLVFLIALSVLGFQLLLISDPLVIFTRSLAFITQMRVSLMLIFIIILVTGFGERFWCRVICPLGALLGVFSIAKVLHLHVQENCKKCNICSRVCPMDAIQDFDVKRTECTLCFECVDKCPQNAVTLTKRREPVTVESRRTFLKAGVAAGAAVLLSPLLGKSLDTSAKLQVIRPPGALKEENFLSVCVRCGECMRVCPSQGLRPVLSEGSVYSLYTPKLVPRIGECQLCMLCWQVCPTGALIEVDPTQMKIGTASVNRDTCLEWRHEKACLVCQEVCPFQAVDVVESGGRGRGQGGRGRRGPEVNRSLCAGCGACENKCPVEPTAITVSPEGEIRY
ncbi:MAG: 4Fe-4S binding protein [Theionarchaea archaeon]|nr:4Fe-4S binding protein [Theionarchaea archaeon]